MSLGYFLDSRRYAMDSAARRVCLSFLPSRIVSDWQPLNNFGGFSGAQLWRMRTSTSDLCLRAWPPGRPSREDLSFIHGLMRRASDDKLSFVPRLRQTATGQTWVELAGRLWELTAWQPGVADFHLRPSSQKLEAAFRALAEIHLSWRKAGVRRGACPAVSKRLTRLQELAALPSARFESIMEAIPTDALAYLARRAWTQLQRWTRPAQFTLQPWSFKEVPLQPCLCDIWHDHVLFLDDRVTGIIDYGGARYDHIATDLARLLGSFVGDDARPREAALEAYNAISILPEEMRELVTILDWTGVVVGAGNWLKWLYLENRQFDDLVGVTKRLTELVTRMEGWRVPPEHDQELIFVT